MLALRCRGTKPAAARSAFLAKIALLSQELRHGACSLDLPIVQIESVYKYSQVGIPAENGRRWSCISSYLFLRIQHLVFSSFCSDTGIEAVKRPSAATFDANSTSMAR